MCLSKRKQVIDLDFIENEFQGKAKLIHYKYNEKKKISKTLYHYTSEAGLKGILRSRVLWFKDYKQLNDPSEYELSLKIVEEIVGDFIESSPNKSFRNLFNTEYRKHKEIYDEYTFSFCEVCDYLPAWRWYGENGKGYSIGFRKDYFSQHDLEYTMVNIRISYDYKEFLTLVLKFFKLAEYTYKKYRNSYSPKEDEFNRLLGANLTAQLIPLMPGFKHFGYKYELEHRLYEIDTINIKTKDSPRIPETRKLANNIVESEQFKINDICEIWVGPCNNNFEASKNEIEGILKSSGYDLKQVEIKQSQMPYRIK